MLGGAGWFSPSWRPAPGLVRSLYEACRDGDYAAALPLQRRASSLGQLVNDRSPAASLKAALELMGRPVGGVRLPLPSLDEHDKEALQAGLEDLGILSGEPHGW